MTEVLKSALRRYLQEGRDALLWKLEGLSEYDARRPVLPTGTNLLGIVKHVATMEAGYFGEVFDRPFPEPMPWMDEDAEPDADFWATSDESVNSVTAFYRRSWEHSDATIDALDLDSPGLVSWWSPETVSLGRVLAHMIAETHRHAGQADAVRELIDGAVGLRADNDNMPDVDAAWRAAYVERLEAVAREAGRPTRS
jgi:uncharacterized damage-inducible protein DinB